MVARPSKCYTFAPVRWSRAHVITPELIRSIREAMRATDPRQPFSTFVTMDEVNAAFMSDQVNAASMSDQTFQATLLTGLASSASASRSARRGPHCEATCSVTGWCWPARVGRRYWCGVGAEPQLEGFRVRGQHGRPADVRSGGCSAVGSATVASLVPALRAVRQSPVAARREYP